MEDLPVKDNEKPLDHEYDGIQELDNPLPGWWLATFYGAIIFSVIYVAYYHFGPGKSPEQELAQDLKKIEETRLAEKAADPGMSEQEFLAIYADNSRRELGHQIYGEKCASCHAIDGGGQIGPNLTDKFWLHGDGSLLAIARVVGEGVPAKGMPPWKGMLKKEELQNVVAYVKTLQGKNPAAPKSPQGEAVEN